MTKPLCKLFCGPAGPSPGARAIFAIMITAIDQAVQAQDPTLAYWQARRTMASLPAIWESPHRLVYAFALEEPHGAVTFACTRDFSFCSTVRFHLAARLLAHGVEHAAHEGVIGGASLPAKEARRLQARRARKPQGALHR